MEFVINFKDKQSVVVLNFKPDYNILASFIWNIPNILRIEIISDFGTVAFGINDFKIYLWVCFKMVEE